MTPDMTPDDTADMTPNSPAPAAPTATLVRMSMPALAHAASTRSRHAQTVFKRSMATGLGLLMVGAVAGALPLPSKAAPVNFAALLALAAFLAAVSLRAFRLARRPDRVWYASRSLAEEVKSLAWRYAVGGRPYGHASHLHVSAELRLTRRLDALVDRAREESLYLPAPEDEAEHITPTMRSTRELPLDQRRTTFAEARIADQQRYYARKAHAYDRRADQWNSVLLGTEALGVVAALIRLFSPNLIDLFGLAGTIVAAGTSWMQLNQYTALADTYSAIAHKLGGYYERSLTSEELASEPAWAQFVGEVEDLLADEHTQWRDLHDPDGYSSGALS